MNVYYNGFLINLNIILTILNNIIILDNIKLNTQTLYYNYYCIRQGFMEVDKKK